MLTKCGFFLLWYGSAENVKVPHPEEFVNVLAGTAGGQSGGTHHSTGAFLDFRCDLRPQKHSEAVFLFGFWT